MAFEDLHICQSCGALFEGDEVVFDMENEYDDEDGDDVPGRCPECNSTNIGSFD